MAHPATAIDAEEIDQIVEAHCTLEGPLLPLLHALQEAFGYVPAQAHEPICKALNITRAELHGVISFYHDYRDKPAGRHVLKICRAEACQSVGSAALAEGLLAKLGLDWHGTTANGTVTVEPVYCLGLCACAPAAMMDDRVVGRVDAAKLDRLLAEAGA
ncbi:formate dehydrogenase subunit gamma [Roseovarius sp. MMSF_3281]|uniref:formate dehydrogenase subunit gamma n=1 Tax=Roseovarius sp. MMSF_3281 TaxID=3046694 RepID=UPI00273D5CAE|nr:formate dehydrogenase subunit gamma [Roseovarius sp. MMSF_3281]